MLLTMYFDGDYNIKILGDDCNLKPKSKLKYLITELLQVIKQLIPINIIDVARVLIQVTS